MRARLNMFTFGYWGWGSATRELVKSVDAVERQRGYRPPVFVDIRIHRSVRAPGFRDDAFERLLGRFRYRWMPGLGNRAVIGESGGRRVRIKTPSAAPDLLALARKVARQRRRVIFFCSCEHPGRCHRHVVAGLLLRAAAARGIDLRIAEWPGGEPATSPVNLQIQNVRTASSPRIPLSSSRGLARLAGLPYGTVVAASWAKSNNILPVGPARYAATGWYLPILRNEDGSNVRGTPHAVSAWRRRYGYVRKQSS